MAAGELETLHARTQELEKDLGNAKALVSKIWSQHPESRGTIERGTGAWLVFGTDVEAGSAQPITQQSDGIRSCQTALGKAPEPKAIAGCEDGTTLADLEAHFSAVKATTAQERDKFEQVMAASHPHLNFDRHSYGYDNNRFAQYKVQWLWEGWLARAALEVKDRIAQDSKMIAPAVLPEPVAAQAAKANKKAASRSKKEESFSLDVLDKALLKAWKLGSESSRSQNEAVLSEFQKLYKETMQKAFDVFQAHQQQAATKTASQAVAWLVYLPSEEAQRVYDDEDDQAFIDDIANHPDAVVTPLYAAPQPQADARDAGHQLFNAGETK